MKHHWKKTSVMVLVFGALAVVAVPGYAADQLKVQDENQKQDSLNKTNELDATKEMKMAQANRAGYGKDLMSAEERMQMRMKMQSAKTEEERNRIRQENHEKMTERAEKQGITLPSEPLQAGPGSGMGRGRR